MTSSGVKLLMMDDQLEKIDQLLKMLQDEGFDVLHVKTEEAAKLALDAEDFALAVLDADLIDRKDPRYLQKLAFATNEEERYLPEIGAGYRVSNWIRRTHPRVGIVVYTSVRTEACDRLKGFQHGADDYIINRFGEYETQKMALEEVILRIKSVISRRVPHVIVGFEVGEYYVDTKNGMVERIDGCNLQLTTAELRILTELAISNWTHLSRPQLYHVAFQDVSDRTDYKPVDDAISKTRNKFRSVFSGEAPIKTIYRTGYMIDGQVRFDTRPIRPES